MFRLVIKYIKNSFLYILRFNRNVTFLINILKKYILKKNLHSYIKKYKDYDCNNLRKLKVQF